MQLVGLKIKIEVLGALKIKIMQARNGLRIWRLVGAIYGPILFWILIINLPKVEWKYVFESNKTRVARHHQKAKENGLPGIPY